MLMMWPRKVSLSTIEAVSMDMGPAFIKSVKANAPEAVICIDPFHVVQLATNTLDVVRRQFWQQARELPDQSFAKKFKGNRYVLVKNPQNLTEKQSATLEQMRQAGGALWEAYEIKESLCQIFAGDLNPDDVIDMIGQWCDLAADSSFPAFHKAAATIRGHTQGIYAAVTRGLSNGPHEGLTLQIRLNNKIRLITRITFGFTSPSASHHLTPSSPSPCSASAGTDRCSPAGFNPRLRQESHNLAAICHAAGRAETQAAG